MRNPMHIVLTERETAATAKIPPRFEGGLTRLGMIPGGGANHVAVCKYRHDPLREQRKSERVYSSNYKKLDVPPPRQLRWTKT